MAADRISLEIFGVNCAKRIERNTATPIVPPICRKKVAAAVETPISLGGNAFCTAMVSGCMRLPSPNPVQTMKIIVSHRGLSAFTKCSRNRPSVNMDAPMSGNIR